jgi:hypothetical protein
MSMGISFGLYAASQIRRAIIRGSQSNVRSTARECIGSTTVPRICK